MKKEFLKKQKIHMLIAGLLPILLAAVVAVLFLMLANAETQDKSRQRAADGANIAAQSFEWLLESGVEKLSQVEEISTGNGFDDDQVRSAGDRDHGV